MRFSTKWTDGPLWPPTDNDHSGHHRLSAMRACVTIIPYRISTRSDNDADTASSPPARSADVIEVDQVSATRQLPLDHVSVREEVVRTQIILDETIPPTVGVPADSSAHVDKVPVETANRPCRKSYHGALNLQLGKWNASGK